jgi:hypothetical protein
VSFYYFGKDMKEEVFDAVQTVEMSKASFPVITLRLNNEEVNLLHGYSNNLPPNLVRESITPISNEQSFVVVINEKENEVKRVIYELRSVADNKLLETETINALDKEGDKKTAKIKFKTELSEEQEYAVKITLVTSKSRKMNYYTRVKREASSYLKEQIAFAMNFHNTIMDKSKAEDMIIYMEPELDKDNSSLSYVDIHSSFDLVSWGKLTPKVMGSIVPTVTDINSDIGSIVLSYTVSAQTASGLEYYNVKELFRVRYTSSRMYLLNYERTMESIFDLNLTSLTKSEFKLGITNQPNIDIVTSPDNNKLAFVAQRELWYYNRVENSAVKVFSFRQKESDYIRDNYDEHDVKILNMDENGNIDFLVFGYMNRGVYEGRVGIVLYRYYSGENRIEELVYIPKNVTYQILKEQLDEFSYVNQIGTFYFTINNKIYAYNLTIKELKVIANDINENNFIVSKDQHYIAWQDNNNPSKATKITILDLETGKEQIIEAPELNNIRLLGKIDNNIIYGFAKTKDITTTVDGNLLVPMYKIEIADSKSNVLKEYSKKGYYISDAIIENNVITLKRIKLYNTNGNIHYVNAESDNILNKEIPINSEAQITKRVTEQTLTEYYISLPPGFTMDQKPKYSDTINTIISKDTTLRLEDSENLPGQYVVYALGDIKGFYDDPAKAIIKADEFAGVVLNNKQQVIWERGAKSDTSLIENITPDYTVGNSFMAGARTLIKYHNGSAYSANGNQNSAYDLLAENLGDSLLNLTGCTLEEVLYNVSKKRPVLAMKDSGNAVLIIGYDLYNITVIDLNAHRTMKLGMNDSINMFNNAGNIFISYTE